MDEEERGCVCEDDKDNTNMDQVICHDDRKQGNGIDFYNSLSMPCDLIEDKTLVFYEVETEEGVGVVRITGGWIQVFWHRDTKTEVIVVDSGVGVRMCSRRRCFKNVWIVSIWIQLEGGGKEESTTENRLDGVFFTMKMV